MASCSLKKDGAPHLAPAAVAAESSFVGSKCELSPVSVRRWCSSMLEEADRLQSHWGSQTVWLHDEHLGNELERETASPFVVAHCCCSQEMPSGRDNVHSRMVLVPPNLWLALARWNCLMNLQSLSQRQQLLEHGAQEMEQSLGSSKQSFAVAVVSVAVAVAVVVVAVGAVGNVSGGLAEARTLSQESLVQTVAAGDDAQAVRRCPSLRCLALDHRREPCPREAAA